MPSLVTHCHIGGTTSLLPTTQGDVECCHGHVALHLYSWLDISGLSIIHSVSELSRHRLYLEIYYEERLISNAHSEISRKRYHVFKQTKVGSKVQYISYKFTYLFFDIVALSFNTFFPT